jgi:hypothetical protein
MNKRVHRRKFRRDKFNSIAIHSVLQAIKLITNSIKLAEVLGIKNDIDRALNSNLIGCNIKSVGSFIQNNLGYKSKRLQKIMELEDIRDQKN